MPIYEYKCTSCGTVIEVLQKMSDKPLKKCEKCSGSLEKLISRSSFQLKGTGWYVTDYARKGKTGGGDSGDSGSGGGSSSGSSKGKGSSTKGAESSAPAKPKKKAGSSSPSTD